MRVCGDRNAGHVAPMLSAFMKVSKMMVVLAWSATAAAVLSPHPARASDNDTLSIVSTGTGGSIVVFVKTAKGKTISHTLTPTAGETADAFAKDVANAFPAGLTSVVGDVVTFLGVTSVNSISNANGPEGQLDSSVASLTSPVGGFSFDPGLTGGTTLASPAIISAGFTSGLSAVSFTEPAGTDISALTSEIVAALDSAGYDATLLDSHDFLVGGMGAILPADFLFGVSPINGVDALGISVDVHDVLEPTSLALFGIGLAGLGLIPRRKAA